MNSIAATLEKVGDDLAGLVGDVFAGDDARGWSERDVLEIMSAAARITRAGEALLVEATAQVCDRSDGRLERGSDDDPVRMPLDERAGAADDEGVEDARR